MVMRTRSLRRMRELDVEHCDIDTMYFYELGKRNKNMLYRTCTGDIVRQIRNVMVLMDGHSNSGEKYQNDVNGKASYESMKKALESMMRMKRYLVVSDQGGVLQ